jgi:FtsP/CotA-like multicopper oxidase with cupredoxin domain
MTAHSLNRRELIKVSLLGAAALALPLERVVRAKSISTIPKDQLPRPFTVPFAKPPVLAPVSSDATTDYYQITQRPQTLQILPGYQTPVFAYNGTVPGPTIIARKGRKTVVRQINELPPTHPALGYVPWTSTHLHGSASLPQFDGYANDITQPGQWKDYHYPNNQGARTLWYHDHGVHHTAENVYSGLAAQYHLIDPAETLPIPKGEFDVPLILGDAMFAADGSLKFDDKLHSGLWGDVILVNGRPWPVMKVKRRKYRFRILNASISRGYRLALSTGDPLTVIATDGGLMPAPQPVAQLRQGMAERYEVVIDFAKYAVGQRVILRNLGVPNSVDYDDTNKVMAFDVTGDPFDPAGNEVPAALNPNEPTMKLTPAMSTKTRKFRVKKDGPIWEIGDMTWDDVVASDFRATFANPEPNAVEIWEIENTSGGWFHPVHIHLVDFQVLSRNGLPPRPEERGPKDVVYVGEAETVRLLMKFEYQTGRYMMHCHNLPHEDHDMMTQFEVGKNGPGPFDAPAQPLPAPPFPGSAP